MARLSMRRWGRLSAFHLRPERMRHCPCRAPCHRRCGEKTISTRRRSEGVWHMRALARLTITIGFGMLTLAALLADEYRTVRPPQVHLSVREWNTPYTLDIPADLSNHRGSQGFVYAPTDGQNQNTACPRRFFNRHTNSCRQPRQSGALAFPSDPPSRRLALPQSRVYRTP